MKRSSLVTTAIVASAAFSLVLAVDPAVSADDTQLAFGGPGYGMGPGGGQGAGPMWMQDDDWAPGAMMGRSRMGGRTGTWPGAYMADADRDGTLTVEEVKTFIESRHAMRGFDDDYKVGEVKELDANTITAKIVDDDGDDVRTLTFPRKIDSAAVVRPGWRGQGYGMRGGRHGGKGGYSMQRRMGGYGPGGGMYGPDFRAGMGYGMSGGLQADGEVTVDEIRGLLEQRLAMWRNPNLKVGEVTDKDEFTIAAQIVTKDGSLVQSMEFDKRTGRPVWNR